MTHPAMQKNNNVSIIVDKLIAGNGVSRDQIKTLLTLDKESDIKQLFSAARQVRSSQFNTDIFLYGFLYFSTYCRNDCSFCQYRNSNTTLPRYRKDIQEILYAAEEMRGAGVHLIDLTMGEDPKMLNPASESSINFVNIAKAVKEQTGLPIMISPGVIPHDQIAEIAHSGIEWFACYQETYNEKLFASLRTDQSFSKRIASKQFAKEQGMLVEEGILLGTGEDPDDIVDAVYAMQSEQFDQVRAMRFIPSKGVTIDKSANSRNEQEYLTIAVMRLLMPDALIPASLDVDGLEGLAVRLEAGANVVTSVVPPNRGLAGVANASLDIDESRRSIEHISPILDKLGLQIATHNSYQNWIDRRRMQTGRSVDISEIRKCA